MTTSQFQAVLKDNIIIFSLCSGILALFLILWITPLWARWNSLSNELPQALALKEDLKQVKSINTILDQKLDKLTPPTMSGTETVDISPDNAEAILDDLNRLAMDTGLTAIELTPELITGKDTASQEIRLTCHFTGPLTACRQMLISLQNRRHIREVERISMLAADNETIALRLVMTVATL